MRARKKFTNTGSTSISTDGCSREHNIPVVEFILRTCGRALEHVFSLFTQCTISRVNVRPAAPPFHWAAAFSSAGENGVEAPFYRRQQIFNASVGFDLEPCHRKAY